MKVAKLPDLAPANFTQRKYSWYSFLSETESNPGPQCARKDYTNETIKWHHRKSNSGFPGCSVVPQATAPPSVPCNSAKFRCEAIYCTIIMGSV